VDTQENSRAFANRWIQLWNTRDLEGLLALFTDAVIFTSPLAAQLVEGSGGVIRGKEELRSYWTAGLDRSPDLRFELVGVYSGVDTVVINFRNHRGVLANEVLIFDGPLVAQGCATRLDVASDFAETAGPNPGAESACIGASGIWIQAGASPFAMCSGITIRFRSGEMHMQFLKLDGSLT
jgi:hypothetical protein